MCGLVGLYAKNSANSNHLKLLQQLLYVDQMRGEHATGLAKVDLAKNEVSIHKKAVNATDYLAMEETKEFLKDNVRLWIGHNRWATMGARDDDNNAHPFQEDHITLVHNGTVHNWTMSGLSGYADPDIIVDSHMVAKTIAELGAKEAITKKLSGAFALVWYDSNERSLNFIRNKERPLWLASLSDGTLVWASEKPFLDFFIQHQKCPLSYAKDGEPTLLPENILYTWTFNQYGALEKTKPNAVAMEFHKSVDPNPPINRGKWQGYYDDDDYYSQLYPDTRVGGYSRRGNVVYPRQAPRGETSAERIVRICKQYGFPFLHEDSEITFDVLKWESFSKTPDAQGTMYGSYAQGAVGVRSFNVYKDQVDMGTVNRGVITNVYEEDNQGKKSLTIVVTLSKKHHEKKPDAVVGGAEDGTATAKGKPTVSLFPQWPLKVHGHTFVNRFDFESLVRKGCQECNTVPTHQNVWNSEIKVTGPFRAGQRPSDLAFICGKCASGGDAEALDRIMEKMNVK